MILGLDISDHAIAAAVVSDDATVVAHDHRETKDAAGAADMARLFERHAPSRVAAAVRDPADVAATDLVSASAGAIADLIAVLDPEVVVLGGLIAHAGDQLIEPARAEAIRRVPHPAADVRIVPTALGNHAGAARAAMRVS